LVTGFVEDTGMLVDVVVVLVDVVVVLVDVVVVLVDAVVATGAVALVLKDCRGISEPELVETSPNVLVVTLSAGNGDTPSETEEELSIASIFDSSVEPKSTVGLVAAV
tara:strand:- start:5759 stop:6082 length:324 start_codon:yes stop_codon:yes gene_type:complete